MNKKLINGILIATLMAGGAASFTSCSDYGDDIDNLQNQIDGITAQVSDLQSKIQSGKLISSVVKTDDGIAITIDGTVYNITNGQNGQDGQNGANGADATVWTIGEDGFWYKDGVKTTYKAIGTDGKDGQDGKDGVNGADGAATSGIYYVPNVETGMFDIYQDGKKVGESDIAWNTAAGSGMTAVFNGLDLILSGVEGENDVVSFNPNPVGSIAFVPSKMNNGIATPDNAFYYVGSYFKSATDFTVVTKDVYMPNEVAMTYRVNPNTAAISEQAVYSFINRDVELSRAGQADKTDLLSVTSASVNEDKQIEVIASANRTAFLDKDGNAKYGVSNGEGKLPVAALVLWNGQARTVSDYITVAAPTPLNNLTIANIAGVEKDDMVPYEGLSQRTANFPEGGESADYLKNLVFKGTGAAASIVYTSTTADKGLDLTTVVGLFAEDANENDANIGFMEDLGFSGITYKFSKPSKYIGAGETNQQDFVDLNGSVLTVTTDSKLTGTAAIGRTPIIRVDAYMNDNFVASAYMKVKITEDAYTGGNTEVTIPTQNIIYNDLTSTFETVGALSWQDVNKYFYGDNNLTAESFWKSYDKSKVKIVATALGTDNKPVNVATDGTAGLNISKNFINGTPTGTDAFGIQINNAIQTQYEKDKNNAGYQDVNGNGAQYTVTITIPALDPLVRGNIEITQTFYVKEAHNKYAYNPVYNKKGTDIISTNGILGDNGVNMSLNLFAAFESANVLDKDGNVTGTVDVQNFYKTNALVNGAFEAQTVKNAVNPIANAKSIKFEVITPKDKKAVAKILSDGYTIVPDPQMMSVPSVQTTVRYTITLENGATCPFDFEVEFVNPLMAAKDIKKLSINGNATTAEAKAAEKVSVVTSGEVNEAIYNWLAKSGTTPAGLGLTATGKDTYKLSNENVSVKYDIKKDAAYNSFVGQLVSGKLVFEDTETTEGSATGVIKYTKGATIQQGATLTVVATVTFADLSVVEVNILLEVTTK